jgi:hypothetical protein
MVMTKLMEDRVRDAIKDYIQGLTLTLAIGTGTIEDEGPDNSDLDAIIAGSERSITFSWDERGGTLTGIVIYGFDAADPDGTDGDTNTETLTEMGMYSGGSLIWRHRFTALEKTDKIKFKVEISISISVSD